MITNFKYRSEETKTYVGLHFEIISINDLKNARGKYGKNA
jgi:hypothetical protein